MKFPEDITSEQFYAILGATGTFLAFLKKSWRQGVYNFISQKLEKAEIRKNTTQATNDNLESLHTRVNDLYTEFVRLQEENLKTQKENFELREKCIENESKIRSQNVELANFKILVSKYENDIKELREIISNNIKQ